MCQHQNVFDSAVDIREIKEIRSGLKSRDFDRHDDPSTKPDQAYCFVILYGTEFRLKSLSLSGKQEVAISFYHCKPPSVKHDLSPVLPSVFLFARLLFR